MRDDKGLSSRDRFSHILNFSQKKKEKRIIRRFLKEKVEYSTLIRAPRRRVFDAMTTQTGLTGWFADDAEFELKPQGEIIFRWQNWGVHRYSGENRGVVVEVDLPNRIVFRWETDSEEYLTNVVMDFDVVDDGTCVRLVESGFEDSTIGLSDLVSRACGWGETLTLLKFFVEHGVRY